jgi:putative flavoprotein involved in K+ transport
MSTQHIETVIVGGGQAGLATAYHLTRRNRPCLVLDGNARIGENWRQQWDTLRLYTPAKYDGLPGMRFPADSWEFPQKDQVADYLESYATHFELPVRTSTRVDRLEARPGGGYLLAVEGETLTCDNVVVATGTFGRTPNVPAFAADLSPSILQMHSGAYRRPEQLQPGAVLVVGASHSGGDIAFEVAPTHHTILCGPDRGQIPLRIESRKTRVVLPILLFMARHVLTRRTPVGRKMMDEVRFHGGPLLRVKREDLADRGVERLEARVSGVTGGRPALQDGTVLDVSNVVWCTGFKQVFDWVRLPIFGDDGWPAEYRGVVSGAPGLYFCGLSFQYSFGSMILPGIGRDAEYVARQISGRMSSSDRRDLQHA